MASASASPRRQAPVGLYGESDRDRQVRVVGRAQDADGLWHVGHRDGRDLVDAAQGERVDLGAVIGLGLGWGHRLAGHVSVAAGTDDAIDPDGRRGWRVTAQVGGKGGCVAVDTQDRRGVVAEPRAPIGAGPPSRRVEHETPACPGSKFEEGLPVARKGRTTLFRIQQGKGREVRQIDPVAKDQRGLQAPIGQRNGVGR